MLFISQVQTGSLARIESIITSLVFDHALRIRLKAETAKKEAVGTSSPATPDSTDVHVEIVQDDKSGSGDEDNVTVQSAHTTASTVVAGATDASSTTAAVSSQQKAKATDIKKAEAKDSQGGKEAKKGGNFVGKLNNLVTSDLGNITSGRDFLLVREC